MGGAFVAVANDSSATWWNPAGLATGPFIDVSVGAAFAGADPSPGQQAWGVAVGIPALGASYYRLRITDIDSLGPTVVPGAGRQEGRVGVPSQSLKLGQFGVTVVHSLFPRLHAGATIKLVHGTAEGTGSESTENHFDADIGLLGVVGPVRLGLAARNLSEPVLHRPGDGFPDVPPGPPVSGSAWPTTAIRLRAGESRPFIVSFDADLHAYDTVRGPRRVLAAGARTLDRGAARRPSRRRPLQPGRRAGTCRQLSGPAWPSSRASWPKSMPHSAPAPSAGWGVAARAAF